MIDNVLSSVQPVENCAGSSWAVPPPLACHHGPIGLHLPENQTPDTSMQYQPIAQLLCTSDSVNSHLAAGMARIAHFTGIEIVRGLLPSCRLK